MADPSIAIARRMARKARVSERNKLYQMGWQHYDVTEKKILEECEQHYNDPIINDVYRYNEKSNLSSAVLNNTDTVITNAKDHIVLEKSYDNAHEESRYDNFNILEHPICLSLPKRIVPVSAWREHIPFGMLLVDILKPKTLVELGVHYGASYCAFCQAVAALQLRTTCYGVDTWMGDPHASLYGVDVFKDLVSHHDPMYGCFSHLIQSTFDDALQYFPNGSIDLLHIDGYHTYEAVQHDFESWLPKVSPRGVVLLHDTNEKQGDFGVWKLWDELKTKYPHFEFLHGHGLGVLAVGETPPKELNWLFNADDKKVTTIQNLFHSLGSRLEERVDIHLGQSGIEWKIVAKLRSFAEVLLPPRSRRRELVKRLLNR